MNTERQILATDYQGSLSTDPLVCKAQSMALLGGICEASLYRLVAKGDLPQPLKVLGRSFWRASWLESYVQQQEAAR